MKTPFLYCRLLIAAGALLSTSIFANSSAIAQSGQPSTNELIEALKGKSTRGVQPAAESAPAVPSDMTLKLIEDLKNKASRGLSVSEQEREQLSEVVASRPSIDLEVYFDFNSSEISEGSRPVLMSLGKALSADDLKNSTFLVAGHTDRKGSVSYNQKLSELRARAVKEFLVTHFNIAEDKLLVAGYGPEKLKNPKRPYAEENRRVQVVNVGADVASADRR